MRLRLQRLHTGLICLLRKNMADSITSVSELVVHAGAQGQREFCSPLRNQEDVSLHYNRAWECRLQRG